MLSEKAPAEELDENNQNDSRKLLGDSYIMPEP